MSVFLCLLIVMKLALKRFSVRKTDSNVKQGRLEGIGRREQHKGGDVHEIII